MSSLPSSKQESQGSGQKKSYRKFVISFVLANLIGAFFLWLTARELPMDELKQGFERLDMSHVLTWSMVFVAIYLVCHGARIVRWYDLVKPLDESIEPMKVHKVCLVGFTAILLLPLRLGEFIRPYLLSRRSNLGMSSLLGTAVVERVIDGLVMTGLLFVTLATYQGTAATGFAYGVGAISAGVFVGALSFCLGAYWRRSQTVALVHTLFGLVSTGLAEKLAGMLEAFIEGFQALVKAHTIGRFLGLTLLYWGTNALSMWVFARWGFGLDVGLWDMVTVMALLVIGIMIPAGPAMAGNFEYFMTRALSLFVVMELFGVEATAFAASVHILQFLVIVLPGFVVMWFDPESRHLISLSGEATEEVEEIEVVD